MTSISNFQQIISFRMTTLFHAVVRCHEKQFGCRMSSNVCEVPWDALVVTCCIVCGSRVSPNDAVIVIYDIPFDSDMCTMSNDQFTVIRGIFFTKRRPGVVFTISHVGSVTILSHSESVKSLHYRTRNTKLATGCFNLNAIYNC